MWNEGKTWNVVLSVVISVIATGCTQDAWDECAAIELGTAASELPLGPAEWLSHAGTLKGPAEELICCARAESSGDTTPSCGIDCTEPSSRAELHELGGKYAEGCWDRGGVMHCMVAVREGQVVATAGFCQD